MKRQVGIAMAALALAGLAPTVSAGDAALIAQGNAQWAAGQVEAARKSFEQAAAADPRSVDAHMRLGGLQLASRDYGGAIRSYQRAVGLDGNNAKAWMGLGLAYLHSGQKDLSRAAFDEAIRIEPARKAQLASLVEKKEAP